MSDNNGALIKVTLKIIRQRILIITKKGIQNNCLENAARIDGKDLLKHLVLVGIYKILRL